MYRSSNAYWLYRDNAIVMRTGSYDRCYEEYKKVTKDFPNSRVEIIHDSEYGRQCTMLWQSYEERKKIAHVAQW